MCQIGFLLLVRFNFESIKTFHNYYKDTCDFLFHCFFKIVLCNFLFTGQEQHIGTKAPPREITLENAVMPSEPGIVRVQVKEDGLKKE